MSSSKPLRGRRIGFVSTRFAGTDGVSLETAKWALVLERLGHACFYFAGESDRPSERSRVVPEAYFGHPSVVAVDDAAFPEDGEAAGRQAAFELRPPGLRNPLRYRVRPPRLTDQIRELARAQKRRPFGEVARELGLVGCFAGPRDLAENHSKYVRRALRARASRR